jgi:hypothetical protein
VSVDLTSIRTVLMLAASAAVVGVVVSVALVGRHQPHPRPAASTPLRAGPVGSVVLVKGSRPIEAFSNGNCLYLATEVSRPGAAVERDRLLRVDPGSGRILAALPLEGSVGQMLEADGILWVTTSGGGSTWLWRLDPDSLEVLARTAIARGRDTGSMVVAGGWLWIGIATTVDRVSLRDGRVTRVVRVLSRPANVGIQVASDARADVLLLSVEDAGNGGAGKAHLELRDAATGALIAISRQFDGATRPYIGGIVDGQVWLSEGTGLMGYVEQTHLSPVSSIGQPGPALGTGRATATLIPGTNGISAHLSDGILWVTQIAGGPERNYCADPATGRPLAPIGYSESAAFLTADNSFVYFVPDTNRRADQVAREPIDPRCR